MQKRFHHHLRTMLIIVTLLVGAFTVHTTSLLTTGIGFGKDARFIVSTENEDRLNDFLRDESRNLKEVRKTNISEDTYLLTMSGVEQIDDYQEKLEELDSNFEVKIRGSFGSLTKLKNNESFIATYFLVFFGILALYFMNRFKTIGYISALELIFLVVGSLFITHQTNYPFTKTLWYGVLISIVMLIYHEQRYLRLFKGRSLGDVLKSKDSINKAYIQTQFTQALFFLFIGLITYKMSAYSFYSVGVYMLALGVLSSLKIIFRRFVLFPVFIYSAKKDENESVLILDDTPMFNWGNDIEKKHMFLTSLFAIFLVFVLALGIFRGFDLKESEDYTNQNVMIINKSDANSYLQLQALLHQNEMIDKQRGYEVSEQEDLWVKFSDTVAFEDLEAISVTVGKEMAASVSYYNTGSALNPLQTPTFYSILSFFVLLAWLLVWSLFNFRDSTLVPFVAFIGSAFFILFLTAFHVEWTREIVYVAWSLPIVLATIISSESNLFKIEEFKKTFLKTTGLNFLILLMMALPVFIIVPTPIAVEMIFVIGLMLISIHFALFVLDILKKIVEGVLKLNE